MNQENIPVAKPIPGANQPQAPAGGRAIASLILGILSIICMGIIAGIPAIILGSMELRAIKAGASPASGEGMAKVGYILGIIGTVLTCLAILAAVAIAMLGISLGTSGAFSDITKSI